MTQPPATKTPTSDDSTPARESGRRGLPIGPLGVFLATAVALLAAGLVIWMGTRGGDDRAVDVNDVLDEVDGSALVAPDTQPVVVNFWSSTCAPCLKEMPDLQAVSTDHASDIAVLGIDVTDTEKAGRAMVEKTGVTFPNARDPQAEVFAAFGGTALPRTVLIDADGKVVEVHNGALTAAELTDLLRDNDLLS